MPLFDVSTPKDPHALRVLPAPDGGLRFEIRVNSVEREGELLAYIVLDKNRVKVFRNWLTSYLVGIDP